MIVLDRAQSLALRRAATNSIRVCGAAGTGKSVLANAIAVQSVQAGLTCLLIGASPQLDKPLAYRAASARHPILTRRAQVGSWSIIDRREMNPLEARARLDPAAMQLAAHTLRRARELLGKHRLDPDEIENSLVATQMVSPEVLDLLTVVVHDASKIADILWSGNRRSGRSLADVAGVIARKKCDVPPDDEPLDLILESDSNFERRLATLLTTVQHSEEEKGLCAVVSALRSPAAPDKTLKEVQEHILSMAQLLGGAIDLVKANGSLEAALKVKSSTHASRLVELFVLKRPSDTATAAIKFFENTKRQFETDGAALAPYLELHGARTVGSFAQIANERPNLFLQHFRSAGSFVQKLREARYAARHLPNLLSRLRAILPASLVDEISGSPIEEAVGCIEANQKPDDRAKAAGKLRQLRDLFASTGFGDLFAAPTDFIERQRASKAGVTQTALRHAPEMLDLLIDGTASSAIANSLTLQEWPVSIARARSQHELKEIASRAEHFDVLVADDADELDAGMLDRFATAGTRVHRIGAAAGADVIVLETLHRQVNFEVADLASQRPGYWLAGPDGLGVVVREAANWPLDSLRSQSARLVKALHDVGYSATLAPVTRNAVADIIVAAVDTLRDDAVRKLAASAREGIVVLCRSDMRRPEPAPERPLSADAIAAQSLGWKVTRASAEGVQLEKDGRTVALVDEPVALTDSEDMVTDAVDRLSSLGWRPIVAWRDAPRDRDDLQRLLESHALPSGEKPFRAVFERLDLSLAALQAHEHSLPAKEASASISADPIPSSLVVSESAQLPPQDDTVTTTRPATKVAASSDQPTVRQAAPGPRLSEFASVNPSVSVAVSPIVTTSRLPTPSERTAESRELPIEPAAAQAPARGHESTQLNPAPRIAEVPTTTRSNPTMAARFAAEAPGAAAKPADFIAAPDQSLDRSETNVKLAVLTKAKPQAHAEPAVPRPIAAISLLVQAMAETDKPSR